jgi:hypothetical protein
MIFNTAPPRSVPWAGKGREQSLERGRRGVVNVQSGLVRQFSPAMACGRVAGGIDDKLRPHRSADLDRMRTAGVKMAAGRRRQRARHVA